MQSEPHLFLYIYSEGIGIKEENSLKHWNVNKRSEMKAEMREVAEPEAGFYTL